MSRAALRISLIVFGSALAIFAPATLAGTIPTAPVVNVTVDAGVAAGVPASTDSVAAGTTLDATAYWDLGIGNPLSQTVTNPTISVASGYDPSLLDPDYGDPAAALPIVFGQPALSGESKLDHGLGSTIDRTEQPGCDTARAVSPLVVPVGGGQQTITFTIRCNDAAGTAVNGGLFVGVPGATLVSFVGPLNLDQGETLFGPPGSWFGNPGDVNAGFGIGLENLVAGKTYTFTTVIQTPNPFGVAFVQKPDITLEEQVPRLSGCVGCGVPSTSITVAEPTLDGASTGAGQVTFSAGESHVWNVAIHDDQKLEYVGTQWAGLDYGGPGSGVVGSTVTLSAQWEDGSIHAGTPVTFTLGSQSCTATTGADGADDTADCTIVLAQPAGSDTVLITSPGDVSDYPVSTSVPFTVNVTASGVCTLTREDVQGSAKYQALKPLARLVTDALVTDACQYLLQIGPAHRPADKAAYVKAYQNAVQALVSPAWLTQGQASLLKSIAGQL